jgi:hypothetical protein
MEVEVAEEVWEIVPHHCDDPKHSQIESLNRWSHWLSRSHIDLKEEEHRYKQFLHFIALFEELLVYSLLHIKSL